MQIQLVTDWQTTGLTGTLKYQLFDSLNNPLIGQTSTGIVEFPSGSGIYDVKITWESSWNSIKVIWTDDITSVEEVIDPPAPNLTDADFTHQAIVSWGVPSLTTIYYSIYDINNTLLLGPTLAIESSAGNYQGTFTWSRNWPGIKIIWTDGTEYVAEWLDRPYQTNGNLSLSGVADADAYFATKLYSSVWMASDSITKQNALNEATRIINKFNYRGSKTDPNQPNEVPRTYYYGCINPTLNYVIPKEFFYAQYEIAFALLKGFDPERDARSMSVTSKGYSSVRIAYDPRQIPEHVRYGVPSLLAWQYLLQFFDYSGSLALHRVS